MKKLMLTLLVFSTALFGAAVLDNAGAYKLNRENKLSRDLARGTQLLNATQFGVRGKWVYDSSLASSSSVGAHNFVDAEGVAITLPNKAVVTNCLIDVVTKPLATGTKTLISLDLASTGDLKASSEKDNYQVGRIACIPTGTVATMIKLAAAKTPTLSITSEAVTAGKVFIWLQYVLSE